jgi:hypothetical protein
MVMLRPRLSRSSAPKSPASRVELQSNRGNQTVPGTPKNYKVEAYLFLAGQESHWQKFDFEVDGLMTLSENLFARVNTVMHTGDFAVTMLDWKNRGMNMIRKSLSYHKDHGVTGFPLTMQDSTVHKIRVFVYPNTKPERFMLSVTLNYMTEGHDPIYSWAWPDVGDLLAAVGEARMKIGLQMLLDPEWSAQTIYGRLRRAMRKNESTSAVVTDGTTDFLVKFRAVKHA